MMWTGETSSSTYNWVQPFVKFGIIAGAATTVAILAIRRFQDTEFTLFVGALGGLFALHHVESSEQTPGGDPKSTRLHCLGLIPCIRGLQFACVAALAAPPLLFFPSGPDRIAYAAVRCITIYNLYGWTIQPTQKAYHHQKRVGSTVCWRAYMGCRGDYEINRPHTCLIDGPSGRGR